jgi:hypothetical protein
LAILQILPWTKITHCHDDGGSKHLWYINQFQFIVILQFSEI